MRELNLKLGMRYCYVLPALSVLSDKVLTLNLQLLNPEPSFHGVFNYNVLMALKDQVPGSTEKSR